MDPVVEALAALDVATVYEASGLDIAAHPRVRPAWPGARVVGRALPVRCGARDNLALHHAVVLARPGEVLVVDAGGDLAGYWGEVLTVAARVAGVAGLVIDGGVRDREALGRLRFPVFAAGAGLVRTAKRDRGSVGGPVEVGGVRVERGDVVMGDADGVIVVPADRAETVARAGEGRRAREAALMAALEEGATTCELLGLEAP